MEDLRRVFGSLYPENILDDIIKEADFDRDEKVMLSVK